MKHNATKIWVYADWEFLEEAQLMGLLTSQRVRGKEIFSFEYTETWVNNQNPILFLDPHLRFYKGKQYLPE
jgi:serine/threonine-protein kinase HipA